MPLKTKFGILIFVLFCISIAFFLQADRLISASENKRIQNEILIFGQAMAPHFVGGRLDYVEKVSEKFGYKKVAQIPRGANILYEDDDGFLRFFLFDYRDFVGFSLISGAFSGDSVVFMKRAKITAWDDYKAFIFVFWVGVFALLAFFLFYQVLGPLNRLHNAIDELRNGIYAKKLSINQKDEIGSLIGAFNEMNAKITRLIKARELIVRNIAHELKTPLAKIKLALNLKEGEALKRDMVRYVDSLEKISQSMLDFERIQEGSIALKSEEFEAESVLFEALKGFDEQKVALKIIKGARLRGDLALLSVAMRNLIENAIKYSSDGRASVELSENGVLFSNKGRALTHDISYYFEPFYRGDITKNGYGLGLSITREILRLHKMEIEYGFERGGEPIFGTHFFYIRF